MTVKELALGTVYFTKEFPSDWEVEWKGNLLTLDPAGFIYRAYELAAEGDLNHFVLPKSLGKLPLGLSFFDIYFYYYGHESDHGWVEDFVLAQLPGFPFFIPRIKQSVATPDLDLKAANIVIRQERKKDLSGAFPTTHLPRFIQSFEENHKVTPQFIGILRRERYSFYLHNQVSLRNWELLADRCQSIEPFRTVRLGQVEFEYKGRDGIWSRNILNQQAVLDEAEILSNKLIESFGPDIIQPTNLTKFEWLIQQKGE
jgi:hypothetical protein